MRACACMRACVRVHIYVCVYVCICVCMCLCVCVCMCARMCTYYQLHWAGLRFIPPSILCVVLCAVKGLIPSSS